MGILDWFSGSDSDPERSHGLVWAPFERKWETWHFGPNDEKDVVYDGIYRHGTSQNRLLYRFVDDDKTDSSTTSFNKELTGDIEVELWVDDENPKWKETEKSRDMYLVADGWWYQSKEFHLHFQHPVMVVTEDTFDELVEELDVSHRKKATPEPRNARDEIRQR